jgi:hypothetical protein
MLQHDPSRVCERVHAQARVWLLLCLLLLLRAIPFALLRSNVCVCVYVCVCVCVCAAQELSTVKRIDNSKSIERGAQWLEQHHAPTHWESRVSRIFTEAQQSNRTVNKTCKSCATPITKGTRCTPCLQASVIASRDKREAECDPVLELPDDIDTSIVSEIEQVDWTSASGRKYMAGGLGSCGAHCVQLDSGVIVVKQGNSASTEEFFASILAENLHQASGNKYWFTSPMRGLPMGSQEFIDCAKTVKYVRERER